MQKPAPRSVSTSCCGRIDVNLERPQDATLALAKILIARPSVTPDDAGCQELIARLLQNLGFAIEPMQFGVVDNLWATHGDGAPIVVFAGHTDVVPTGPLEAWTYAPFVPTEAGGWLYGRGAADMKSSIAAMITAFEAFLNRHPKHRGTLAVLLTSDEEGPAVDGTTRVIDTLTERGIEIDYCVVGEPSSEAVLGDTIKNGRRGSLSGALTVRGIQGHVAYPDRAENPIHGFARALNALVATQWDEPTPHFPATSFQVSNVHAGTGASNVIPGTLTAEFNLRFSTTVTVDALRSRVEHILDANHLKYTIDWSLRGLPYLTHAGRLVEVVSRAIRDELNVTPRLSTAGGTSDGRFIAPTGAEVVELGPINATIHQIDECIRIEDLAPLSVIYRRIIEGVLND